MIQRRLTTLLAILAALLAYPPLLQADGPQDGAQRPNFVFIYADDWRWDCLGTVQREQGEKARFPWLQTPRLDRLAEEGLRFRNAFVVNSLCSPGRACVLTGQYSHANGIVGNSRPMPLDKPTLATRLKDAGYNTAYCGKFHMDGQRERPGFSFVASFVGQGRYNNCPILLNGRQTATEGWIDDVSTDYAIKFLETQRADKPFFLFLGFKSPHGPRGGENLPPRVRDLYPEDAPRSVPNLGLKPIFEESPGRIRPNSSRQADREAVAARAYMRHITAIDGCVGRVLEALDRSGQAANTVVIVTSDNGYYVGEHGLSDKRSAYEESIRVPLLVRAAGAGAGGGVRDEMVLNIDHAQTVLELADAEPLPETHGSSMRPLLSSAGNVPWRNEFVYEYFKEGQFASPTVLALRTATHKYITYPDHDEWTEVFDLANDPYETKNLVANVGLRDKLKSQFDEQLKAVAFRMPDPQPPRAQRQRRNLRRRAAELDANRRRGIDDTRENEPASLGVDPEN
jgi:arylsulfatase A-like enzyme